MRTDEPGHLSHELRAPDSGRVSHPLDYLGPRRLGCHLTFLAWPRGPWCLCICASSLPSAGSRLLTSHHKNQLENTRVSLVQTPNEERGMTVCLGLLP